MTSTVSLDALAAMVPDGAKVAVAKQDSGSSIAATLALIRRGVRRLHLVCVPVSSLQADLLIGAGCIETLETSAVSLGEYGSAPQFCEAVKRGRIRLLDATCPAVYAGLQAAQKGLPFMPLRGILGSDVLANRPDDWRVIDNPFGEGDPIVAIRAIRPDFALFHAMAADRFGNVLVGRDRDGLLLSHAAGAALVTVERIVEGNLLDDPERSSGVVPAMYVGGIALAPQGTAPLGFGDEYPTDGEFMTRYAANARSQEGFEALLAELQERAGAAVAA
ncbi:MAG: CoA-transferase [Burkholderiaceae bacterium]